uniref:Uncharacterized protein n=1 Tax=Rhizophora mucronata TaxID=61149 RepID=A0A2P2NZ72_RHIMU
MLYTSSLFVHFTRFAFHLMAEMSSGGGRLSVSQMKKSIPLKVI